jgi:hypothetical protein
VKSVLQDEGSIRESLNKLSEQSANLTFELPDNTPVVRLGLIATLYFKEGYSLQSKCYVMQCFTRFKEEFGQHLKGQFDDRYKKLTDSGFSKTQEKIRESGPNEQYEWHISSAATANEAAAYSLSALNSFEVHGDQKRSYLKMTLPWSFLKELRWLLGNRGCRHRVFVRHRRQQSRPYGLSKRSGRLREKSSKPTNDTSRSNRCRRCMQPDRLLVHSCSGELPPSFPTG